MVIRPVGRVRMLFFSRQFKQILFTSVLVLYAVGTMSQVKPKPSAGNPVVAKAISRQLKDFYKLTTEAGVVFNFPAGFKEIRVLNNEDYSFDYAMEIPGREFEVWFQVKSQRENWANYVRYKNDPTKSVAYPDSLYIQMAHAQASAITGDQPYYTRDLSREVVERYHANAGRSYLLNLADLKETKHYKYALLLTLQKDHIGTILALCFTNEKTPEFFKDVNRMSRYIKFRS